MIMTESLSYQERRAAQDAAQAAIAAEKQEAEAKADKLKADAAAKAKRVSAALEAEALKADIEARDRVARATILQVGPLVSAVLETEMLEATGEARAKYRTFQRAAERDTGRLIPLAPFVLVAQRILSRHPALKSRIARLDSLGGQWGPHAAREIEAVHRSFMGEVPDLRSTRTALFDLEKRLFEIGRIATPGAFTDQVWEAVQRGQGYQEIQTLCEGLSRAQARAEAEAQPPTPMIVKAWNAVARWGLNSETESEHPKLPAAA